MSGLTTRRVLLPALALASIGALLAGCAQEPSATASPAAAASSAAASSAPSEAAASPAAPQPAVPAAKAAAALPCAVAARLHHVTCNCLSPVT